MSNLLMPKATAVWLVDNTALAFQQIADFCSLHPLEVKAIADGDSATLIKGLDPVGTGQLSREEIEKGEGRPWLQAEAIRSQSPSPHREAEGPALHPCVAAAGSSQRSPLAASIPRGTQRFPDLAPCRHHQTHDQ